MSSAFTGFTQAGLTFLQDVRIFNSKTWFDDNRAIYDAELMAPFRALVDALSPTMLTIDAWFETKPVVGKTLSRIHRDTRFSKDKTRYRSQLWLMFRRASPDWKEAPAFFFEISPDSYRYGMGYYCAPKSTMDLFRQQILDDPQAFLAVVKQCGKHYHLEGESYKRPLIKDQPAEIADWYNRKSFAVLAESRQVEDLFSPKIVTKISKEFKKLAPLYHYLMRVEFIKNIPD